MVEHVVISFVKGGGAYLGCFPETCLMIFGCLHLREKKRTQKKQKQHPTKFPKVPQSSQTESLGFPRNTPSPWTPRDPKKNPITKETKTQHPTWFYPPTSNSGK